MWKKIAPVLKIGQKNEEEIERILWVWGLWDLMLIEFFFMHSTMLESGRDEQMK